MSVLKDYEKRCGRDELTSEEVADHVHACEKFLARAERYTAAEGARVTVWLYDRLHAVYYALEYPGVPAASRCAWCFRAGPQTDEAWSALPKMTLDDATIHSQVCEHNPLVQEIRKLTALLDGFVHSKGDS